VAKKIQNEEDEQRQKKTIYLEVGKKTQTKKTDISNRLIYGTFRSAMTYGVIGGDNRCAAPLDPWPRRHLTIDRLPRPMIRPRNAAADDQLAACTTISASPAKRATIHTTDAAY
jgi:hypothetical protein